MSKTVLTAPETERFVYHKPDPDNPDDTDCKSSTDYGFEERQLDDLGDKWSGCQWCHGEVEQDWGGYEKQLAYRIRNMSDEELAQRGLIDPANSDGETV